MVDTPLPAWAGLGLLIAWVLGEGAIHLLGWFQPPSRQGHRAGLTWLQMAFAGSLAVGWFDAAWLRWSTAPAGWQAVGWAGVGAVAGGLLVRLAARATLAKNFSAFVQTTDGHRLVTHGLYRRVRHPAYAGFVGFLVGFPLAFQSLTALCLALGLGAPALAHRIRVEERALEGWFGDDWRRYAARTARLAPGVW